MRDEPDGSSLVTGIKINYRQASACLVYLANKDQGYVQVYPPFPHETLLSDPIIATVN